MSTDSPILKVSSASLSKEGGFSSLSVRPWAIDEIVLGLGQGGFFDGIVFHQLLQWHPMFSGIETDQTIAGMELNTLNDGLFHLLDWILTLAEVVLMAVGLVFIQTAKSQTVT